MSGQYVLILGAGLMQKPSLEAAAALGYKTLVVDANPDAVCVPFADRFEPVDLKDKDSLLSLAKSLGSSLAGVFTAGTDFSASVSYVAEGCSLPSHSFKAACNASDKILMRTCFKNAGIPSPSFRQITRPEIASFISSKEFEALKFPCVVKPVDNMGARGCRMIRNKTEFLPAVEEAVRASRTGRAILEEYMKGDEYSIDALVYDGTLTITGFADRHIFYEPYFIETGHTMPTQADDKKKTELIDCFAKAVSALGLTHGAAKADIKYTKDGPMIGEIAARLSGGYMSGWTYPYASSINLTKQALLLAVGASPEDLLLHRRPVALHDSPFGIYEIPCREVSAERAWISIPGKVQKIYGVENLCAVPFVQDAFVRTHEGDAVSFPRNNVEKCGNVISRSPSYALSVAASEKAVASVVLRLNAPNQETESFLAGKTKKSEAGFPPSFFVLEKNLQKKLNEWLLTAPAIKQDEKVRPCVPPLLEELKNTLRDCNSRTIEDTVLMFDRLCPTHPEFEAKKFWTGLLRGGIQALLYLNDVSVSQNAQSLKRSRRK